MITGMMETTITQTVTINTVCRLVVAPWLFSGGGMRVINQKNTAANGKVIATDRQAERPLRRDRTPKRRPYSFTAGIEPC
jgi:hypothetical protein